MEQHDCDHIEPLLEAFDDNELDTVTSFTVQEHLDTCVHCRARHAWGLEVRASFSRIHASTEPIPIALHERIRNEISASRRRPLVIAAGMAAMLLIGGITALWTFMHPDSDAAMDYARNHVASLTDPETATFTSTDASQTEAWLSEHLPFSVVVPRKAPAGYTLLGARLCHIGAHDLAYLFYGADSDRAAAPISLFIGEKGSCDMGELEETIHTADIVIHRGECDETMVAAWETEKFTYVVAGGISESALTEFARQGAPAF